VDALADSLPLLEEYLLLLKEVTEEAHVDLAAAFPQHRVLDVIRKLTDLQVSLASFSSLPLVFLLTPSLPRSVCSLFLSRGVLRGWCLTGSGRSVDTAPILVPWSA